MIRFEIAMGIMEFVCDPNFLNDQTLSRAQTTVLKSIYGMPLNEEELTIYRGATGREKYLEGEQKESTIICGRRGGKTGKLAASVVCFEAFRDHGLPRGEDGYIMLLAPTLKQARIAFRYIRSYLRKSPILRRHVAKATRDEITLTNNVVIGCYASTHDGVRGRTIIAVICDEIGFWPSDDDAASPAEEVLAALRPGMATVRNAKILKISTPFIKVGLLWDEFSRRGELNFAVWQLTTFEMNPTVKQEDVEHERGLGEEKFRREYLAQFAESINCWINSEFLNTSIVRGRLMLPPRSDVTYVAALDAASRSDDFAFAIVHKGMEESVIVDYIQTWTGTKKAPLVIESVLSQIKDVLDLYGINSVTGDQYYSEPICQQLLKLGIVFNLFNFSASTRTKLFVGLKHLLMLHKIELLDDVVLLRQLQNLREEKSPRGQVDVRPSCGKDDTAVAVALAVHQAIAQQPALPFDLVPCDFRPSPASLGMIPERCPYGAICRNFPTCLDSGYCLGFENSATPTSSESRISFTCCSSTSELDAQKTRFAKLRRLTFSDKCF
jgi:hypothetical protein